MQRDARYIQPLNGIWELQGGSTLPEKWTSRVPVPALVDCADPPYDWQSMPYHYYRLRFRVETGGHYDSCVLRIEQAMFGTEVSLNGHPLGGDIACYTSQEYDVRPCLRTEADNELIVRVGLKETLPAESAVGRDQERQTFIPGIWGDVSLIFTGGVRVMLVQVIPRLRDSVAESRVTIRNLLGSPRTVRLASRIREKSSVESPGRTVAPEAEIFRTLNPGEAALVTFTQKISPLHLWSPDSPFLYEQCVEVTGGEEHLDATSTTFGMREFHVERGDFMLNGNRIFLKGGNIAFHRFLSDSERGTLPWNMAWVKKLLIDIPKAHNFNFFRNHIGQLYNRWYDVADEYGMLMQNEWMFWTTSGSREQILKEFTRWLQDNGNHPSIIIWDALNESSDPYIEETVIPAMKKLDPTRPWEPVDFCEEHPYIYSLGPVLNGEKFGFARPLQEIENSVTPSMVNEFLWWWLDKESRPTLLTKEVIERWLGPSPSEEEIVERQSFLAGELVELFRRMRVDAIQPFVYLSNSTGPTGHWFLGDISELVPKKVLATLRNAFAPFGVSIELWDRHFFTGETRLIRFFVFNDHDEHRTGVLRFGVVDRADSTHWFSKQHVRVTVGPSGCSTLSAPVEFPSTPCDCSVVAELYEEDGETLCAVSRKIAFVYTPLVRGNPAQDSQVVLLDRRGEIAHFLAQAGVQCVSLTSAPEAARSLVLLGEGMLRDATYQTRVGEIGDSIRAGGTLVVIEPEFGVEGKETVRVLPDLDLTVEWRRDADKGGYDSYVFAEDPSHALWRGIRGEDLKMFNGGLGGEMVSQHTLSMNNEMEVLARCGLKLAHPAVFTLRYGKGRVVISRIQLRGRLVKGDAAEHLYTRRVDPVAQHYLLNLLATFTPPAKG